MAQITTVIPTYRRPKLLKRAILSVLRQSYKDLQVHVYDNASDDTTEQVVADLASADSRVKYHRHRENIGLLRNCIHGIEQVETPYFHVLCDDDLIFPHFYELAVKTFDRRPKAMLFAGATIRLNVIRHTAEIPLRRWKSEYYQAPEGLCEILHRGHPDWTGILFRRSPEAISSLDLAMGNWLDVDLTCRYAALYPLAISNISCAILVQHESAFSIIADEAEPYALSSIWPKWLQLVENMDQLPSMKKEDRDRVRRLILRQGARQVFFRGCKAAAVGDVRAAENAASVLASCFGSHLRAHLLDMLAPLSRPPVSFAVKSTVYALRRLRTRSRETILPSDEWQRCSALMAQVD